MERAVPQASYMPLPKAERFQTQQKRGNSWAVDGTVANQFPTLLDVSEAASHPCLKHASGPTGALALAH